MNHSLATLKTAPFWILVDQEQKNAQDLVEKFISDHKNKCTTLIIEPEGNAIKIDDIKTIRPFLAQKTDNQNQDLRIVIIKQAHTMNNFAQNALLKLFEQSYLQVYVFLITSELNKLRPTIQSRFFKLHFDEAFEYPHQDWIESKGGAAFISQLKNMIFAKDINNELIKKFSESSRYFLNVIAAIIYNMVINDTLNAEKGSLAYEKLNKFIIESDGANLNPEDQMIAGLVIVQMCLK